MTKTRAYQTLTNWAELGRLVVLFGKPGAGKDAVACVLAEKYNYHIYQADEEITYMDKLRRGEASTDEDRDKFCLYKIDRIKQLQREHAKIVVNWAFIMDRQRRMFHQAYPAAEFVLVETPREVIAKRLTDNPRQNHVLTTEMALTIGKRFERPTIPHRVINNAGTESSLRAQL